MKRAAIVFGRTMTAAIILPAVILAGPALADKGARRDLTVEQTPIVEVGAGPEFSASKIQVEATLDHPNSVYAVGENVRLQVRASEDAYITVLEVGTSGKVHVIFPNQFVNSNRIAANNVVSIPMDDSNFRIRVSGPAGRDVIKVFATREPLDTLAQQKLISEGPFFTAKDNARSIARDLTVELHEKHKDEFGTAVQIFEIVEPGRPGVSVTVDDSGGRAGGNASVVVGPNGAANVQAGSGGAGGNATGPNTVGGPGGKGGDAILCKGCVIIPK